MKTDLPLLLLQISALLPIFFGESSWVSVSLVKPWVSPLQATLKPWSSSNSQYHVLVIIFNFYCWRTLLVHLIEHITKLGLSLCNSSLYLYISYHLIAIWFVYILYIWFVNKDNKMICQNLINLIDFNFYLICIYLVVYRPLYKAGSIIGNIIQAFSFCCVFIFFSISWNNF